MKRKVVFLFLFPVTRDEVVLEERGGKTFVCNSEGITIGGGSCRPNGKRR